MVLHLIQKLVNDTNVTQAFDFYVVPMANPDGYVYSNTTNRMWRKNRAKTTKSNCPGVDLNRNWDYQWGIGGSTNPCTEIYQGPKVFSEPETKALKKTMLSKKDKMKLVLAIHSQAQSMLYPWGWTVSTTAPDAEAMKKKGETFAAAAKAVRGTVYPVSTSSVLGLAGGATDDWAKAKLSATYVYTLELPNKLTFNLPASQISPTAQEIWAGLHKMLEEIAAE